MSQEKKMDFNSFYDRIIEKIKQETEDLKNYLSNNKKKFDFFIQTIKEKDIQVCREDLFYYEDQVLNDFKEKNLTLENIDNFFDILFHKGIIETEKETEDEYDNIAKVKLGLLLIEYHGQGCVQIIKKY
jgi:hypothetical protein